VVITGRREENLKEVASRATGGKVIPIVADVTNESDWERVVATTISQFGGIDGAIMNAGTAGKNSLDPIEADTSELIDMLLINNYGPILGAKFCVPSLIKSKGTLIIVSSMTSTMPRTYGSNVVYSATKSAADQLVRQFSAIYLPKGVNVFGVNPVAYDSSMTRRFGPDSNYHDVLASKFNPLGKLGNPLDIAAIFLSLLTNDTKYKPGDCVATFPSHQDGKPLTIEMSYFYKNVISSSAPGVLQQSYLSMPLNDEKGEAISSGDAEPIRQSIIAHIQQFLGAAK